MCKCTPGIKTPFCGKPGCEWPQQKLEVVHDHVGEKLDEMADLCEHWKRHRERGRNPTAIRAALLMLAQECAATMLSPEMMGRARATIPAQSGQGGYQPVGDGGPTQPPPRSP